MKSKTLTIGDIEIGNTKPFTLISGLNVIESGAIVEEVIGELATSTRELDIPSVFKASFDKANRSSINSFRGPGIDEGLEILSDIKSNYKVPVLSDVHNEDQIIKASKVLDIIQIPAFLCRQTDLVLAAAKTDLPINVKKGQFLSPEEIKNIIKKILHFKNEKILLCERGTTFGYNNLVVDMIGLSYMKSYGFPVIFDVTHSLQEPGGLGDKTAGRRKHSLDLAKSAMSIGLGGLFLEVHPNPSKAKCDGPCALPLKLLKDFLYQLKEVDNLAKSQPSLRIE